MRTKEEEHLRIAVGVRTNELLYGRFNDAPHGLLLELRIQQGHQFLSGCGEGERWDGIRPGNGSSADSDGAGRGRNVERDQRRRLRLERRRGSVLSHVHSRNELHAIHAVDN